MSHFIIRTLRISIGVLVAILTLKVSQFLGNSSFFQVIIFSVPFVGVQALFEELKVKGLLTIFLILISLFFLLKSIWINTKIKNILIWING